MASRKLWQCCPKLNRTMHCGGCAMSLERLRKRGKPKSSKVGLTKPPPRCYSHCLPCASQCGQEISPADTSQTSVTVVGTCSNQSGCSRLPCTRTTALEVAYVLNKLAFCSLRATRARRSAYVPLHGQRARKRDGFGQPAGLGVLLGLVSNWGSSPACF